MKELTPEEQKAWDIVRDFDPRYKIFGKDFVKKFDAKHKKDKDKK